VLVELSELLDFHRIETLPEQRQVQYSQQDPEVKSNVSMSDAVVNERTFRI